MSEYLNDKPKKLVIKDGDNNIKNIQEFKHNHKGDPAYYKKIQGDKVTVELEYEYEYDNLDRKTKIKIIDKIENKITVMEYEY